VSDAPATPRPAATVLLLRHGGRHSDRGVEVLLCRRSTEASFMPGVWVFPGGMIEEGETAEECAARELAEEAGIELGEEAELVAWSRWITPEVVPVRFDTHFFVALAEPHAKAEPDHGEITDVAWWAPQAALDSHAQGELKLVFPTIKTLETLVEHETAEAVIEAARGRDVQPILPRVVGTRESHRVLMPWEDGYEDGVTDIDSLPP
jgi:8-oxo-dGTP pyrophosphatase MutT (NUDIX family)